MTRCTLLLPGRGPQPPWGGRGLAGGLFAPFSRFQCWFASSFSPLQLPGGSKKGPWRTGVRTRELLAWELSLEGWATVGLTT